MSIITKAASQLTILKGQENYNKWASTMTAYFMMNSLWKAVNGTSTLPVFTIIPRVPAIYGGTNNSNAEAWN